MYMANSGGVVVDVIWVVVESGVVEVEAEIVKQVLFLFGQPLPLPALSETNIYNM